MVQPDLAIRIEHALDTAGQSRIEGIAALPGNPLGVEIRRFGSVTATVVRRPVLYYGYYTTIRGLATAEPEALSRALAWMKAEGAAPRVTTCPALADEPVLSTLHDAGLKITGFMSVSYSGKPGPVPEPRNIRVEELPLSRREVMERLWLHDAASNDAARMTALCAAEFRDWRVFTAALEGQPAAAYGCLHIAGSTAVLASGYTHPASRGRGLQTALIHRRIACAIDAGCDLIISTAAPDSQSERNLRRAGLTEGYLQSIWS